MTSIFTKIIEREVPAHILYEDDRFISILDLNPITYGHALVIPKEEVKDFTELDHETIGPFFEVAQKIAAAVVSATKAGGFNLIMSTGRAAGQEVFHAHAHIIPRFADDGIEFWHGEPYTTSEQMKEYAELIQKRIAAMGKTRKKKK